MSFEKFFLLLIQAELDVFLCYPRKLDASLNSVLLFNLFLLNFVGKNLCAFALG